MILFSFLRTDCVAGGHGNGTSEVLIEVLVDEWTLEIAIAQEHLHSS
jgi:hypothetical protein